MRLNESTVLVGERVVLVPYRKIHVATYHAWMKSPELLETTASEPLSLEEEYDMQKKWHLDDDKLTFIVLARSALGPAPTGMLTEAEVREEIAAATMTGDVNIFLHEPDEDGAAADLECEVMIAEPSQRRKGLALEALSLLLIYAQTGLKTAPTSFIAKIGTSNDKSLALFARLGFGIVKTSEVFEEHELRFGGGDGASSSSSSSPSSWQAVRYASGPWPLDADDVAAK